MPLGTVKWFNVDKGFGFIVPDTGGPDVFMHITAVQEALMVTSNDGQRLSYDTQQSRQGKLAAISLRPA